MYGNRQGPVAHSSEMLNAEIERAEELLQNLRILRVGGQPAADLLASAPFIDCWGWMAVPAVAMHGIVAGHPKLENGGVTTSIVLVDGHQDGWVRTRSRLYRVGTPLSVMKEKIERELAARANDRPN